MLIRKIHIATGLSAAMLTVSGLVGTGTLVQAAPEAQRSVGCTQEAAPGGGAEATQGNRSRAARDLILGNVVGAAVENVAVLSDLNTALSALNGANVQVVCLNDVLNQNDIRVLNNILNSSPILSDNLNNSLNNNEVLRNALQNADISLLNNVQVVSVDVLSGEVFVLRQ